MGLRTLQKRYTDQQILKHPGHMVDELDELQGHGTRNGLQCTTYDPNCLRLSRRPSPRALKG